MLTNPRLLYSTINHTFTKIVSQSPCNQSPRYTNSLNIRYHPYHNKLSSQSQFTHRINSPLNKFRNLFSMPTLPLPPSYKYPNIRPLPTPPHPTYPQSFIKPLCYFRIPNHNPSLSLSQNIKPSNISTPASPQKLQILRSPV